MEQRTCLSCGTDITSTHGRRRCETCRPKSDWYARNGKPRRPALAPLRSVTCEICETEFVPPTARSRHCSKRCQIRRRDLNRRVPCDTCGNLTWPSKTRPAPTCMPCRRSRPGYRGSPDRSLVGTMEDLTCATCGCSWARKRVRGQRPRHCPSCRAKWGGDWISGSRRRAIYERDNWICGVCLEPIEPELAGTGSPWRASLDHIIPRANGGSDDDANLRAAHMWCNVTLKDGSCYSEGDFRVAG